MAEYILATTQTILDLPTHGSKYTYLEVYIRLRSLRCQYEDVYIRRWQALCNNDWSLQCRFEDVYIRRWQFMCNIHGRCDATLRTYIYGRGIERVKRMLKNYGNFFSSVNGEYHALLHHVKKSEKSNEQIFEIIRQRLLSVPI